MNRCSRFLWNMQGMQKQSRIKMRQFGKKIIKHIKKSKKLKQQIILIIAYLTAILFTMCDAWLYHIPIAKLTEVETIESGETKSTRGTMETEYKQSIRGIVLNGKSKGKMIGASNEYTYTGMLSQKYHKGDKVFLNGTKDDIKLGIRGLKRDTELVSLIGFLFVLLVIVTGRQGVLTIITVLMNIVIFIIGFICAENTSNVLEICSRMIVFFAVATLIGLNGINKKTIASIVSTLIVLVIIMGAFDIVITYAQEVDYSTMEYLGSIDNPDEIFHAEILLSGIGAIMDVAVAIATALSEIIRKKPDVTFLQLFKSGREIGYDIMGTMINVLLFVFVCGLIPTCLIRMNNEIRFMTIIKLHIPCELCRFFIESIGIVLAIPVSILITSLIMKMTIKRRKITC